LKLKRIFLFLFLFQKPSSQTTFPYKINATQLTQERQKPKHSNHFKEKERGGKSLVSLHEKFPGSSRSYAKKKH
jgi:hypothetical protein